MKRIDRSQIPTETPKSPVALGIAIGLTTIVVGLILAIVIGALTLAATEIWQQVSLNI